MRLGEILLDSGILSDKQLIDAQEYSQNKLIPLGRAVRLLKMVSDSDLQEAYRARKLMALGLSPSLALIIFTEVLRRKAPFYEVLKEKMQESGLVPAKLQTLLISGSWEKEEDPELVWLNTPGEVLLQDGDNFFEQDRISGAEQCYDTLRKRLEAKEGRESDSLIPVLRRLANLYMVCDRYGEADELYCRILQIKQTVYGKHHISVALALEDLADLYQVRGLFNRAQSLYLKASGVLEKYLPDSLVDFVGCLKKLLSCSNLLDPRAPRKLIGTLLTEAGLLTDEQLRIALKYAKKENLPLGAVLKQECLVDDKALQSFLEVQALIADGILSGEAALQAYKGSVLSGIPLLTLLYDAGLLENLENEKRNLRLNLVTELDELIASERGLGVYHREVAMRAIRVGNAHAELGNLQDAEQFYHRAVVICNKDRKNNGTLLAFASKQMGKVLIRSGRPLLAEPLFMEALDLLQAAKQSESRDSLEILEELSLLHYAEKNYGMCWNLFSAAMDLCCRISSVTALAPRFLEALNQCALEINRGSEAEELYVRAIKTLAISPDFNDRSLSFLNMKLGDFYRDQGQPQKARIQYDLARKVLSPSVAPGDKNLQILERRIAQLPMSKKNMDS